MCAAPSQHPGLGREVGREREAKLGRWLMEHRSLWFFDFPFWFPDKESARETNPMSGWLGLRRYLSCFLPWEGNCTWLKDLGRTEAIWTVGTCCFGPFHLDGLFKTFPAQSFPEGSSRSYAGGNPYAGHPCSPPFLRNTALIPVACLHGKPRRHRIQLA